MKEAKSCQDSKHPKMPSNKCEFENEIETTIITAKKLKSTTDMLVPENDSLNYRILNFHSVFNEVSKVVKCKTCGGNVTFQTENSRGLGFQIVVSCDNKCKPIDISSCPKIGSSYEINRRFSFAMCCLGQGASGEKIFCGLMDLPPPVAQKSHDDIQEHIHIASKFIAELSMRNAVQEEQLRMSLEQEVENTTNLAVSGDGTWQKHRSSLHGVCSLVGVHSKKIIDVNVKSSYCEQCEILAKKKDTKEYNDRKRKHRSNCRLNHKGSAEKMEVDSIKEMFCRSEKQYGVKYMYYIGDDDSKTYKGVVESKPYGDKVEIEEKERIEHAQKRMSARLRKCKKDHKGIRNKLTEMMIDKLSVYYDLAIQRNFDSVEGMRNAVWATFYHYNSTAKELQHHLCPEGSDSWCKWQRAKANGSLYKYKQSYDTLPHDVLKALCPVYQDLSNESLLKRYFGGYTQNANKSFNNLLWRIAPKNTNSNAQIETATFLAVCLFNNRTSALLKIMIMMGITIGRNAVQFAALSDTHRYDRADILAQHATREARMKLRVEKNQQNNEYFILEDFLYGLEIDDYIMDNGSLSTVQKKKDKTAKQFTPNTKRKASGCNWETYKSLSSKTKTEKSTGGKSNPQKKHSKPKKGSISLKTISRPNMEPQEENGKQNTIKNKENKNKETLTKQVAMDCEMVGIGDGTESMIARVSIVNKYGDCVYDKYVKPREKIVDYRTAISGIRPEHVEKGENFNIVQKEVADILKGRILVGHALKHDLSVLYLSHPRRYWRDTSRYKLFRQISKGNTPSLKKLAHELLGREIQVGEHSSVEDAKAAMQLYMLYKNKWESEKKH